MFIYFSICLPTYISEHHVQAWCLKGRKRVLDPLELQLHTVLGTELGSSPRAATSPVTGWFPGAASHPVPTGLTSAAKSNLALRLQAWITMSCFFS